MKISRWMNGNALGLAAVALLGTSGCAHRELTAPCSDYKAASFAPAAAAQPGYIPCDKPVPLSRTAALERSAIGAMGE